MEVQARDREPEAPALEPELEQAADGSLVKSIKIEKVQGKYVSKDN